jgi:uroporphyrinogen III methyltransferase/synthase
VYQNVDAEALPEEVVQRIMAGSVDWITLTSSAIAARLHSLLPEAAQAQVGADRKVRLASLSPVTSETVNRLGWSVSAEASVHTWNGLVQAIVERVQGDQKRR